VPVLLVTVPDLQRVFVPAGTEETDLRTAQLDERVERDGRAVDHEVASAEELVHGSPEPFGDRREPVADGSRWIVGGRRSLEELDRAVAVQQH